MRTTEELKARLILEDGSIFYGRSFGDESSVAGEVVFNTAMTGYPESLTDPSYVGQLLVLTYPLVGNYGVPPRSFFPNGISSFMESERIHIEALIVSDYSHECSHWNAVESLGSWLKKESIPGIYGIDTRALTKLLRQKGSMKAKLLIGETEEASLDFTDPNLVNLVEQVSCKEVITYGESGKKVILLDCGVKHNILRSLLQRGVQVIRVPWDYDFNQLEYDGLFISNGPGDPDTLGASVAHIRQALNRDKPICGICMGNQLLAKAGGANIFKLKYGHRSHNQPVQMVGSNTCYITSQNHGYAVDNNSLGSDWEPLFINLNDGTNEGIRHKSKAFFSAQFHPEACSGPTDTLFIFDQFVSTL